MVILVTGATGNVGGELVPILIDAGEHVRALVRHLGAGLALGAELARGNLNQPESLRGALAGCRALFLLPGHRNMAGLLAEACGAGVTQVVLLSCQAAEDAKLDGTISAALIRSEEAVRASGLHWTILRPMGFMSNTLAWIPQLRAGDVVRAPFATVSLALIDPYDVAAVAAVALSSSEHHGRHYPLSGPEPLRPADRVRVLGQVLRRRLRFEVQPDDEARTELTKTMHAEEVAARFDLRADGTKDHARVYPTVEQLTGRPPRRFEQWARAYADEFR